MDAAESGRVAVAVVALLVAAGAAAPPTEAAVSVEGAATAGTKGGATPGVLGASTASATATVGASTPSAPGDDGPTADPPGGDQTATPGGEGPDINESEPPFDARTDGESLVIVVENGSTRLTARVNYSLLAGLPEPGQLRLRATGDLGDERVVALTAGVRFEGAPSASAFAADPLSYVEVLYDYRFSLPFPTSPDEVVDDRRRVGAI